MDEKQHYCDQHSGNCRNIEFLEEKVDKLDREFSEYKKHSQDKFDSLNKLWTDMEIKFGKLEILISEKFREFSEKLTSIQSDKRTSKQAFVQNFVYPGIIAIVLFAITYFTNK